MLELLSLTNNNDLILTKIDNYYLCLAEPSKRVYDLNWYQANKYCKSLGEGYSLPSGEELNLIYTNKGHLSLVEACLYGEDINTLDFISILPNRINKHEYYPWVWSSSKNGSNNAWGQYFNSGNQYSSSKNTTSVWVLPVRRVPI